MYINFIRCVNNPDFLKDLARFKTVDKYIESVFKYFELGPSYKICPNFVPLDLCVKITKNTTFWFVRAGEMEKDAKKKLRWLKNLVPAKDRHFVSDFIIIEGDGFEHELCISWDDRRSRPEG